jgi:hypothetical protein
MLLERSSLARPSVKAEAVALVPADLAQLCEAAERRRKAPCQYRKYARSGREADAVRGHSFSSAPTRSEQSALERLTPPFFAPLTPARWEAMRLAASFAARYGLGGAVPAGTIPEPRQNGQATEIIGLLCLVLGFQRFASRHARVRICVSTCAYMCARKARTSEPLTFIQSYHMDRGSRVVLEWFWPEPAPKRAGCGDAFPPISNKIGGGNAPGPSDRPSRGLMRGRGGESFGLFGLGGRADRARCSSSVRAARNGGKARLFAGGPCVVGTPMLERMAEGVGNPRFFEAAHLPSGKAAGRVLGGRRTPPCPHSRSQPPRSPSRARVAEFGSAFACSISGSMRGGEKSARRRFRRSGPGEGLRPGLSPVDMPGRGARDAAGKLRRRPCMGGGASRVN